MKTSIHDFIPLFAQDPYGVCILCNKGYKKPSRREHVKLVHKELFLANKIIITRRAFIHRLAIPD